MHHDLPPSRPPSLPSPAARWSLLIIALCCVLLLVTLKQSGLMLVVPILAVTFLVIRHRPDESEARALRSSIQLSLEDITDTLDQFLLFRDSPEAEHLADRTLHRPALLDPDCPDPAIQKFHFEFHGCRSYIHRLHARLAADLSVPELEALLATTDARALELRESWLAARGAAHRLGTDYKRY
ncbi:hypothetical protein [Corynebacterium spheniscorum]|uniref:Uncharacterized protein n=1 Tax=Corynebacterium spheniscorum TaxID=185761 RepID=A0A1I2R1Y0_9CORY|nr:hypothetical protein [Corynebacterium spheniscorum]SFG34785.1 hypothetical protein SAMN05660282_00596 [Corynebacterium spheniscorum]